MKNIIIDTDPGIDDAIALMYAFTRQELNINLISSAGGNCPVKTITENAIHLVELFGKSTPVVQGASAPLKREAKFATAAQGPTGLGKYNFNRKKLAHKPLDGEACDVIYQQLKANGGKTTIVSIGPMTNIAKMILKHPDCVDYIEEFVFESGTKEKIYGKPYKSFNTGYDPEATDIIFKSGIPLVMIPMELGHFAYLDHDEIKRFRKTNKLGKIFGKMFKRYNDYHVGKLGAAVHDVCAIYYIVHPERIKSEKAFIEVKYYNSEGENFGYIDIDFNKTPNATVCFDLDINTFKEELFDALKSYN